MQKKTSLEEAIEELEEIFLTWPDEALYRFILEAIEKPLIELIERTGGDADEILKVDKKAIQPIIKEIKGLRNKEIPNPQSEIKIRR